MYVLYVRVETDPAVAVTQETGNDDEVDENPETGDQLASETPNVV